MKRILYITGTRADFGLMQKTLQALHAHSSIELSLCVTGMHLSQKFGDTLKDIKASGLPIIAKAAVPLGEGSALEMAVSFGLEEIEISKVLATYEPDAVLLLGDRGEMLAAAIAAAHFAIPVMHIGGGERSGTIDESIRHALSRFAHYHFVTTDLCKKRLIKMGEEPSTIYRISAPGLDALADFSPLAKSELYKLFGFEKTKKTALCLFHPVVQRAEEAGQQMTEVLKALAESGVQCLVLEPNADAGSQHVRAAITTVGASFKSNFKRKVHLKREQFLSCLAHFDVMVGNSSSGIIEAASFGIPVINIGSRQNGRERNGNIVDVDPKMQEILAALTSSLAHGRYPNQNIYGQPDCYKTMPEIISAIDLKKTNLEKMNTY